MVEVEELFDNDEVRSLLLTAKNLGRDYELVKIVVMVSALLSSYNLIIPNDQLRCTVLTFQMALVKRQESF